MDAGRFEPLALVEAMSVHALPTGVEVKLTGTSSTPELSEPPEKSSSVPARSRLGKRDEIIDVEVAPPCEALAQAKPGDGYWLAGIAQRCELVARELLGANPLQEGCGVREITQMSDHRETSEDVRVGFGEVDLHDELRAAPGLSCGRVRATVAATGRRRLPRTGGLRVRRRAVLR